MFFAQLAFAAERIAGELSGVFSVSETKLVHFSRGNLQLRPSNKTWRFAPAQYTIIGANNAYVSDVYTSWVDLFCWSTSATYFGANISPLSTTFKGNFVDWGKNKISNGGNEANLWYTLSMTEWEYVLDNRPNALSLRFYATVNNQTGMVLLPDDFVKGNFQYTTGVQNFTKNKYTTAQWQPFEEAGAVFLPCAGGRVGYSVSYLNTRGAYYSSTPTGAENAFGWHFEATFRTTNHCNRCSAHSVRLVRDVLYTLTVEGDYGTTGSGDYKYMTPVVISADVPDCMRFVRWSDGNTENPRTVTVTGDATYTATFEKVQYTITTAPDDATHGSTEAVEKQ